MWHRSLHKLGLALAVSIAYLSVGPVASRADEPLKAALESRYADMKAAITSKDSAAIAAILAPDFASVDVSGQSKGTSQMIADVTAMKPDPNRSSETTLLEISPTGNSVTVQQRYHMKTVATTADGAQHSVELVALSTDTWVKPGDVWLLQRTATNELSLFRDGQVVAHKKKP